MCTCNEQSGVCSECSRKYKRQELTIGKKYKHKTWSAACTLLAMTSKGKFVFEDTSGSAFNSAYTSDFTEIKEKQKRWINIYRDGPGTRLHKSRKEADEHAMSLRIDCIEVEVNVE